MNKQIIALSLVLAFSSVSTAFAAIPKNLRIGTDPTYAPFESKNAQGELVGFDIDLAKELCKRIETNCTFVENQGQDSIYADLTAGRIDAAFQDEVAASEGFLKQPVGKDYQFGGPSIKDDKLFGVGTGMGLRKDDTELRQALNKAFAEMRKDGTYEKLAKKYFDFDVYGG